MCIRDRSKGLFGAIQELASRHDDYSDAMSSLFTETPSTFPSGVKQLALEGKVRFWFTPRGYRFFSEDRDEIFQDFQDTYPKEDIRFIVKTKELDSSDPRILYQDEWQVALPRSMK